jgi:hypothetical protein
MSKRYTTNYPKSIIVPVKPEMAKALKKIAFENETSMSELARTALLKLINKYEKKVDSKIL